MSNCVSDGLSGVVMKVCIDAFLGLIRKLVSDVLSGVDINLFGLT